MLNRGCTLLSVGNFFCSWPKCRIRRRPWQPWCQELAACVPCGCGRWIHCLFSFQRWQRCSHSAMTSDIQVGTSGGLSFLHNLSLSILICLLSDSSPAASLFCLLQTCFFFPRSSFFSPSFRFVLISLSTFMIPPPYFFVLKQKKSYLLLHHLAFCHSSILLFLLLSASVMSK